MTASNRTRLTAREKKTCHLNGAICRATNRAANRTAHASYEANRCAAVTANADYLAASANDKATNEAGAANRIGNKASQAA